MEKLKREFLPVSFYIFKERKQNNDTMVLALSVSKLLATVIQNGDSTIHWINFYPLDNPIGLPNTYLLDSDL